MTESSGFVAKVSPFDIDGGSSGPCGRGVVTAVKTVTPEIVYLGEEEIRKQ